MLWELKGLPWWLSWPRIHLHCRRAGFNPWLEKVPWRRKQLPTPVFWPGEFHRLYCSWDCKESDTTERLSLHFIRIKMKDLGGKPMCSCEKQLSQAATGTSSKVSPLETYPQQDPPLVMHKAIYFKYSGEHMSILGFPDGLSGKESTCNAGDSGSIPGLGRCPGGGNDNPLKYSCLKNSTDSEAWWPIVQRVTKSWTQLSDWAPPEHVSPKLLINPPPSTPRTYCITQRTRNNIL